MLKQASLCLLPQQMVNCEFPPLFFLHPLPAHLTGPSTYRLLETRKQVSFCSFPARSLTHFSHSHIACARVPLYVCGLYDLCTCMCMLMCAYDDARMLLYLVQGQRPRPEQQRAVRDLQVRVCILLTGLQRFLFRRQRPQF